MWCIGTHDGLGIVSHDLVILAAFISAPLTHHTPPHAVCTVYSCESKRAGGRRLQNVTTPCHTPVNEGLKASPRVFFRMSIYK